MDLVDQESRRGCVSGGSTKASRSGAGGGCGATGLDRKWVTTSIATTWWSGWVGVDCSLAATIGSTPPATFESTTTAATTTSSDPTTDLARATLACATGAVAGEQS